MIAASERFLAAKSLLPGCAIALVLSAAASFLASHYSAPVMLYALLLGMAFGYLTDDKRNLRGIEFASTTLLRIGVALLGLRISWIQISALGWEPVWMVAGLVIVTIAASILLAKMLLTTEQLRTIISYG